MFKWLTVLRRLSKDEEFLAEHKSHFERLEKLKLELAEVCKRIKESSDELESLNTRREEFHEAIAQDIEQMARQEDSLKSFETKAVAKVHEIQNATLDTLNTRKDELHMEVEQELRQMARQEENLKLFGEKASAKVQEIQNATAEYVRQVNGELNSFDKQICAFNAQVAELKQSVTDYLR